MSNNAEIGKDAELHQLKVTFMQATSNFFRYTAGSGKYNQVKQEKASAAMKKVRGQYQMLTGNLIDRVLNKRDGSSNLTEEQQIAKKLKLYGFKR